MGRLMGVLCEGYCTRYPRSRIGLDRQETSQDLAMIRTVYRRVHYNTHVKYCSAVNGMDAIMTLRVYLFRFSLLQDPTSGFVEE